MVGILTLSESSSNVRNLFKLRRTARGSLRIMFSAFSLEHPQLMTRKVSPHVILSAFSTHWIPNLLARSLAESAVHNGDTIIVFIEQLPPASVLEVPQLQAEHLDRKSVV